MDPPVLLETDQVGPGSSLANPMASVPIVVATYTWVILAASPPRARGFWKNVGSPWLESSRHPVVMDDNNLVLKQPAGDDWGSMTWETP